MLYPPGFSPSLKDVMLCVRVIAARITCQRLNGVNVSPLIACAVALGPTAVGCVSAAAQAGLGMYF